MERVEPDAALLGRVPADDEGKPVRHTPELVTRLFDEELERILRELPADVPEAARDKYRQARQISEEMITRGQFNPV